jgi:hypothetical protein
MPKAQEVLKRKDSGTLRGKEKSKASQVSREKKKYPSIDWNESSGPRKSRSRQARIRGFGKRVRLSICYIENIDANKGQRFRSKGVHISISEEENYGFTANWTGYPRQTFNPLQTTKGRMMRKDEKMKTASTREVFSGKHS